MNETPKHGGDTGDSVRPLAIVMVRHGQAAGEESPANPHRGLTPLGKRQAASVGARLAGEPFDHIYISDLTRAHDTAREIVKRHPGTVSTVTADLREVLPYHFTPGPSPRSNSVRRAMRLERDRMEGFAADLKARHGSGRRVLLVCHGNIIRVMLCILAGRNPKRSILININNTSVTALDVWPGGEAVLRLANCVAHLLPEEVT